MILEIIRYKHPCLRKRAEEILEVTPEIRALAKNMIETVMDENVGGLGLAAPQVNVSLRMFVLNPHKEDSREPKDGFPLVVLNPKLSNPSEEQWDCLEGCLSIPGMNGNVIRPVSVRLEGTDLNGNTIDIKLEGLDARIAMHENDHLNGVLYIDRMEKKERQKIEPLLQRLARTSGST